ncbi:hypothetical protein G4H71_20780 [Rhodococcus triatomae]|uniref:Uncharacterized protein n=1 Tax=Rhodococcus triatomae TaxID=300028 RepID=A0A1G8KIB3_9NOCA|nr:hypothetical protein [Rhodococcus triatomae]QNG18935.1 hypothetical protein G4H72_09600 [Rhodococcus triatomae]QNG25152.1 hypothetical protein G4H71_20780 [Rhodococcus triatomae]SDI43169.1 hypothetical protein SAMN05444695_107153 [Rhodococcus triatomae]
MALFLGIVVVGSSAGAAGQVYPAGYALVSNYGQAGYILDRFDEALGRAAAS